MNSDGRHIHLGTRAEIAERVRQGRTSAAQAASELGVEEGEVRRWVESGERPLLLEEIVASPESVRLTRRAQRLVALITSCDATIRSLTRRLEAGASLACGEAD